MEQRTPLSFSKFEYFDQTGWGGLMQGAAKSGFAELTEAERLSYSLKIKDLKNHQVGFGPEHGIDNIGCYWFYCNASNGFGQKCLVCPTDLSHVTDFIGR